MLLMVASPLVARAAAPKVPQPTEVDFLIQGEYSGQVFAQAGEPPIGVQVAASARESSRPWATSAGCREMAGTAVPCTVQGRDQGRRGRDQER